MNRPKNNDPMSVGNAVQGASNEGGDHLAAPLGPITGGRLEFVRGASNVTIHADLTTKNLYRARFEGHVPNVGVQGGAVTIRYPRFPLFDRLYYRRERPAEVALNASIPWDIEVRDCASRITADLRGLKLGSLNLGGGASRLEMMLPRPSGTVSVRVLGGASNVSIHRPEGVAARVYVGGGATNLTFDEKHFGAVGGEVDLRSPDYDGATDRYDIAITGGANNLSIEAR